ncbi:myo-inosose-2 dehydratase [Butyricicoccus faecihominis]|uniref:myo-inosose-2 dehydratase n=1 Tax=Butyricicoccus faecihominis TaxID=1712515 RepID=UPI002478B8C1|nr:myo-inosose-2 dehydratase [Butyricicoccus faecihominis]MCQ5130473.1 myo-inosose-2 dehydratase [Butyricicoccus faecihominis]
MERRFYNVKIGAHPINWCNDDMDFLGDEYTFEQIIDEAAAAGYAGIELGRKFPRDPKILRRELGKRDLVLTSGWCDTMFACAELRDEYFHAFQEKARFFQEMGCRYIIAAEGTNSSCWDPREYRAKQGVRKMNDTEWKLFTDGLNEAGAFCQTLGMELVYHVHTGTVIETLEETQKMCDMTDSNLVFILADTGHLKVCGVNIPQFFETFANRIRYVHLKDVRPLVLKIVRQFNMDFNSAVQVGLFTVPGDGCIDYPAVFDILEKNHYQGWMMVEAEQYIKTPNAYEFAEMARGYIRKLTGV